MTPTTSVYKACASQTNGCAWVFEYQVNTDITVWVFFFVFCLSETYIKKGVRAGQYIMISIL